MAGSSIGQRVSDHEVAVSASVFPYGKSLAEIPDHIGVPSVIEHDSVTSRGILVGTTQISMERRVKRMWFGMHLQSCMTGG